MDFYRRQRRACPSVIHFVYGTLAQATPAQGPAVQPPSFPVLIMML